MLLRGLKRWTRVSEGPSPTTSALEHTETKAQTTATGMWLESGQLLVRLVLGDLPRYSKFDCGTQ